MRFDRFSIFEGKSETTSDIIQRVMSNFGGLREFELISFGPRGDSEFFYRGMRFKLIYIIDSIGTSTSLYFLPPLDEEDCDYIKIFSADEIVDFVNDKSEYVNSHLNAHVSRTIDKWIDSYDKFMEFYSEGHIDDMLADLDVLAIHKEVSGSPIKRGWLLELGWDITIEFNTKRYSNGGEEWTGNKFESGDLIVISDFIRRMESFGFDCQNGISDNSIYIFCRKKMS